MREVPIDEAWKFKYPEQIVFVTSIDAEGKFNIMSAGWFTPLSGDPPLVGVSVAKNRYTRELIAENREFVIAFPAENMKKEVLFCGTHSGREVDKFKEADLEAISSRKIKPPLVGGCVVNFECKVVKEIPAGNNILFIGEIVAAHVCEEEKHRLYNFGNLSFKRIQR